MSTSKIDVPKDVLTLGEMGLELVDVLLTRHVEMFFSERRKLAEPGKSIFERNGDLVRAAIRAEILVGIDEKGIDTLPASSVQWLSHIIDDDMAEKVAMPGLSSGESPGG